MSGTQLEVGALHAAIQQAHSMDTLVTQVASLNVLLERIATACERFASTQEAILRNNEDHLVLADAQRRTSFAYTEAMTTIAKMLASAMAKAL